MFTLNPVKTYPFLIIMEEIAETLKASLVVNSQVVGICFLISFKFSVVLSCGAPTLTFLTYKL